MRVIESIEKWIQVKGPEIILLSPLVMQTLGGTSGIIKLHKVSNMKYFTCATFSTILAICAIYINIYALQMELKLSISLAIMSFFYRNGNTIMYIVVIFKNLKRLKNDEHFGYIAKELFSTQAAIHNYKNLNFSKYLVLTTGLTFAIFINFLYMMHRSYVVFGSQWDSFRDLQAFLPQVVMECEMIMCATFIFIIADSFDKIASGVTSKSQVSTILISEETIEQLRALPMTENKIGNVNYMVNIAKAYERYKQMADLSDCVRRYFRLPVLLYLHSVFWYEIISLAIEILMLMKMENHQSLNWSLGNCVWTTFHYGRTFTIFFFLCWSCEWMYTKVDDLKANILNISTSVMDLDTRRRCRHTLHAMNLNPVTFTVYGIFRVDLRLVVHYIGLVTSYMIIVLQFYIM